MLASGSQAAFNELYERYHRGLYLNIMRSVRNTEEAEDILQEVFFTLWKKRKTLSPDKSVGGWLFTLSYNRTVDLLRKKIREKEGLKAIPAVEGPDDHLIIVEEQHALLEQAIQQLSPQKKRVFELCKLQGQSYEKAAAELGISKYTVGEYLKEAMAFVKQYIQQHPYNTGLISSGVLAIFLQ